MARDRRPHDDDDDDRPVRRYRPADDDEDEDEPRVRKKRRVDDDDDDDEPRSRRVDDDDDERPRKRRFKKKNAGNSKGLLIGLIVGGVALVGLAVLLIVLLGGGGSPKDVMARIIRASKSGDFGTVYDNMASSAQQFIPREQFIELGKAAQKAGGSDRRANMTVVGETITGDTAIVRVREAAGWEDDVPFVKENGRWKMGKFR